MAETIVFSASCTLSLFAFDFGEEDTHLSFVYPRCRLIATPRHGYTFLDFNARSIRL
jgi:hypothetical protein